MKLIYRGDQAKLIADICDEVGAKSPTDFMYKLALAFKDKLENPTDALDAQEIINGREEEQR